MASDLPFRSFVDWCRTSLKNKQTTHTDDHGLNQHTDTKINTDVDADTDTERAYWSLHTEISCTSAVVASSIGCQRNVETAVPGTAASKKLYEQDTLQNAAST